MRPSTPPKCSNCNAKGGLYTYQDGGHDYCIGCYNCGARYGIQGPPFDLVERVGDGPIRKDWVDD